MSGRGGRRLVGVALLASLLVVPWPWGIVALGAVTTARLVVAGVPLARRIAQRRTEAETIVLGRERSGGRVALTDRQLEAHALIVGASGAGKTTTLETILAQQIARGRPVVAIDMKGSAAFASALAGAARGAGRELRVFTPERRTHWNPLAHGGPTALKDMLMSAERFSEPHYQRAAERYLQTALTVLEAVHPGRPPALSEVVDVMAPPRLAALARRAPAPLRARVAEYVSSLPVDQANAAAGLGTRLALLSESVAGPLLDPGGAPGHTEIDLAAALDGGDVVLFSLNSSTYGKLASQLGALAIQALTSAAGRRLDHDGAGRQPATVALDEFSALGADNVLSLLARGREAGISVLLATQELSDLERAAPGFRDQVLGITALKLAHRQEVDASAAAISRLAGTERVWRETTRQLPALGGWSRLGSRGTRSEVEQPVVHPNEIKRLSTGQLVLLSNVPEPRVARTTVRPPPSPRRSGTRTRQTAPGVTR
ncbi:MAG TPA: helicase HerA-like domain-containing protein [Solirubrobacteraceae bacterium]|nr:helicase HerA-like domain-containing protein [Solirubrobacteraceae bacterium]